MGAKRQRVKIEAKRLAGGGGGRAGRGVNDLAGYGETTCYRHFGPNLEDMSDHRPALIYGKGLPVGNDSSPQQRSSCTMEERLPLEPRVFVF